MASSDLQTIRARYMQPSGKTVEEVFTDTFTIGRDAPSAVRVTGAMVSAMHARVSRLMGGWWVQDLYSQHGLYVDGRKVQQVEVKGRVTLQLGKEGPYVELSVGAEATMPAAPPSPTPSRVQAASFSSTASGVRPVPQPAPVQEAAPETEPYRAHRFSLALPKEGWKDATAYILAGPHTEGIQHNITINVDPNVPVAKVEDYADMQVQTLEDSLKGVRILKRDPVQLTNGMPAHRVIYTWAPSDAFSVFQEQLYVLHEGCGFQLTATYSRKTREKMAPLVERIMLSFTPEAEPSST